MLEHSRRYEHVQRIIQNVPTDDLPNLWVGLAVDLAIHAAEGTLPEVTSSADVERLINAADKLHKMGRLAAGQSTANTATLHMDAAERDARTAELRARLAAMDTPPPSPT